MLDVTLVSPPLWTTIAFVLLILSVQGLLLYAVAKAFPERRSRVVTVAVVFAVLMALTAGLAESGLLARDQLPPPGLLYFAIVNGSAIALALSGGGRALALAMAPSFWVLFHSFRLPLEVLLDLWNRAGTIPEQMTWHGQNLDILTGIVALILGLALRWRPQIKALGYAAHAIGLVLLLNVGRVAVLSVPTPFKAFDGPPLVLPFHAPYTWIAPFAVGAALFAHIVGLRGLMLRR